MGEISYDEYFRYISREKRSKSFLMQFVDVNEGGYFITRRRWYLIMRMLIEA